MSWTPNEELRRIANVMSNSQESPGIANVLNTSEELPRFANVSRKARNRGRLQISKALASHSQDFQTPSTNARNSRDFQVHWILQLSQSVSRCQDSHNVQRSASDPVSQTTFWSTNAVSYLSEGPSNLHECQNFASSSSCHITRTNVNTDDLILEVWYLHMPENGKVEWHICWILQQEVYTWGIELPQTLPRINMLYHTFISKVRLPYKDRSHVNKYMALPLFLPNNRHFTAHSAAAETAMLSISFPWNDSAGR